MNLLNRIEITAEQARTFRNEGALRIKNFLNPAGVEKVREMVESDLGPTEGAAGKEDEFKRRKYNVGNRNPVTRSLLDSPDLRKMFQALIPGRLLFTQGVGFELTPGKAGLDWHFDLLSFAFIHPLDQGYTVWIPFDRIDPAGQRGGLEYVPEDAYSARDKMVLTYRHILRGPEIIERAGGRDAYRAQMPCSSSEKITLEEMGVEPEFNAGDALITNRFVWHRSCPLGQGPIRRRLAFVMRFVDADARYDGTFCRKLEEFCVGYGNTSFKAEFGLSFTDLKDGDRMFSSQMSLDVI